MSFVSKSRLFLWILKRRTYLLLTGFVLILLLLVFWPRMVFVIESGHAGVVYRTFWGGTVTNTVRDEGLQVILPWNTMTIYDVRLQQVEQKFAVISNDGLEVYVTLAIRYAPKIELLGLLHKKIGPDYLEKIIIPDVQSLIRTTFGQYTPEEIYRTKRSLIQETVQSALSNLGDKYVEMDDLLIKSIELPESIKTAIENKHVEQQLMLQMSFRIDREKLEAERKEIEAKGVDRFQTIVNASLTPQLLQYKGIDALAKLAESPNAKLVLAGGGANGIPLILDTSTGGPLRDQAVLNLKPGSGPAELPEENNGEPQSLLDLDHTPGGVLGWMKNRKNAGAVNAMRSTPKATPSPTPGADATPKPSASPTPTPAPSPASDAGDESSSEDSSEAAEDGSSSSHPTGRSTSSEAR